MKKIAWFLFLFAVPMFSQTSVINDFCVLGAVQASVSGLKSSNYMQGIISQCTVTVYLDSLYSVQNATYLSGGVVTGTIGKTCTATFLGGTTNGTGTIALTGTNAILSGTAFTVPEPTGVYSTTPTTATFSSGTATCSGTATISAAMTPALATLYSDASDDTLSNPFTATSAGQWLFYAATSQTYDIVLSGGISPNTYPSPVTLVRYIPSN